MIQAENIQQVFDAKTDEWLSKEAQNKEISKSELVRHIIYGYQQKKESSEAKKE